MDGIDLPDVQSLRLRLEEPCDATAGNHRDRTVGGLTLDGESPAGPYDRDQATGVDREADVLGEQSRCTPRLVPGFADVRDAGAVDHERVPTHPDRRCRMMLGVHGEDSPRPDHHVVDVGASLTHLHRVQDPPPRTQPGQLPGDGLFAVRADAPRSLGGLCPAHPGEDVAERALCLALGECTLASGRTGTYPGEVAAAPH